MHMPKNRLTEILKGRTLADRELRKTIGVLTLAVTVYAAAVSSAFIDKFDRIGHGMVAEVYRSEVYGTRLHPFGQPYGEVYSSIEETVRGFSATDVDGKVHQLDTKARRLPSQ